MKAVGYSLLMLLVSTLIWVPAAQAGWSYDPEVNDPVCVVALGDQSAVEVANDGAGGYIAVWVDARSGGNDIYAQRVDAVGGVTWTAGGVAVCTAAGDQSEPRVVCDGAGGAVVTWVDARGGNSDIYAQRMDASGAVQWAADGVAIAVEAGDQDGAVLASDGSGGAYIAWEDHRADAIDEDAYAQLVDAGGAVQWAAGGIALSDTTGAQKSLAVTSDPAGPIFVWSDDRAIVGGIHAARTDAFGTVLWESAASLMVGLAVSWDNPVVMADGWGGAFITCEGTNGTGQLDILGQRVSVAGAPLWGPGGVTICDAALDQSGVRMVPDDTGGIILAWSDERSGPAADVYAQGLDGWGASQWLLYPSGLAVSNDTDGTGPPDMVADGAGGAVITWHGGHTGYEDIYAQRVGATGAVAWTFGGEIVSSAFGRKWEPRIASDGSGGGVIFWSDLRNATNFDVYAQRIERNGFLGYPAPEITTVRDYPDDQGGEIIVSWAPSYLDVWPHDEVGYYSAWRRYGGTTRGDRPAQEFPWYLDPRDPEALGRDGWEQVGAVQSHQLPEYSFVVPTYGDSTIMGISRTDVIVLAHSYAPEDSWMSEIASGYSIDNLSPGVPESLAAVVVGPHVDLTWQPSGSNDEDLSHYDVHRSDASGFLPDETTHIGSRSGTHFTDLEPGDGLWFYRVVAEDIHGNQSGPSDEASVALGTGIGDHELSSVLTIRGNAPNPFNPITRIEYDLPVSGLVRLSVYSAAGELVATIEDGFREAGRRQVVWSGTDGAGSALPSGVYFARLEAGEERAVHTMVLLK